MKDVFDSPFNEGRFREFLVQLLPDFQEDRRPVTMNKNLGRVWLLGRSELCKLEVLKVRLNSAGMKRRTMITREMFEVLKQHRIRNALVVFYDESDKWRLSLLTSKLEIEDGKVVSKTSNPKRYSYLLGVGTKTKTPRILLLGKGGVMNLEELRERFSVEIVNKEFYHAIVIHFIKLVGGERMECGIKRHHYPRLRMPKGRESEANEFAVRLVGRIIFCWFLKEKRSEDGRALMPETILSAKATEKHPGYYHNVLEPVFFGCLNTKFEQRKEELRRAPFNQIPYLNGGLFNPQASDFYKDDVADSDTETVTIKDAWFTELFEILAQYNFTVDENTDLDVDLSIDPEMLGRIFENLLAEINPETGESARKATGSFYTPREIVSYMIDQALLKYLVAETNIESEKIKALLDYNSQQEDEELSENECSKVVAALAKLKVLDPACGSGAFPIGILQKVFYVLQQVDQDGQQWYKHQIQKKNSEDVHKNLQLKFQDGNYDYIRKLGIIQQSIFGVDIQPIATEITKLRCFLTLMIEEKVDDTKPNRGIHPLPNLDFKFVTANTLKFLPENPNDPFNMFETGESVETVREVRDNYFSADKSGRVLLKTEFNEAQSEITGSGHELAEERYRSLAKWQPFVNTQTDWFDSEWMFGVKNFDIVIGNPPYGAKISESDQKYFLKMYKAAQTGGGLKGVMDTVAFFIERGLGMLKVGGNLVYIVPMTVASNETMAALQNEMERQCQTIRIASFSNRPRQIFDSACIRTSILELNKTKTPLKNLYMTRLVRRSGDTSIQSLIEHLDFVEAHKYKMHGRYPKVGSTKEVEILKKLFKAEKRLRDYQDESSREQFYYRAAGGRYFNIVTLEASGTSAEREYRAKNAMLLAACMSTSLFWFYQQVYTDGLNLKEYEVDMYPVPDFEKVDEDSLAKIKELYLKFLDEIEKNVTVKGVADDSRYKVRKFKEYKIGKSKELIDKLDDMVDILYGLTAEEIEYIKKYEKAVRMGEIYS